jgi:hypothetical protein
MRSYLREQLGYRHVSRTDAATDPGDGDSTTGGTRVEGATPVISQENADFLIGQPAEDAAPRTGQPGGNLPGDQGNIDFGDQNDTGPFTSQQRGGDPGDLGDEIGGAPLASPPAKEEEGDEPVVKRSKLDYSFSAGSAASADDDD